jgi:heat shock protein HtpX
LGVVFSLLASTGLGTWMRSAGGLFPLMVLCLFWGMGGAFLSLLISRWIAKRTTGAEVLDPATVQGDERWLVETVHRLARTAGITTMPEVAIYPSAELNAFATGPTKNRALVAVSEGLLASMNKGEIEGVLGHEMSHVANGDMVTLTLVQGVVNAFVMFVAEIIVMALSGNGRREEGRGGFGGYLLRSMIYTLVQSLLFFAAYIAVIAPFSRGREFRADAGGALRAGRDKMIAALEALKARRDSMQARQAEAQARAESPALAAFKISGEWNSLLSTHPPLEERLQRLRLGQPV